MSTKLERLWATKNKNDEWWSSFVTSPLAIAANLVVADLKWVTPNGITLVSFITAIASCVLIIIGGPLAFIAAALLIHASHVLDCMDGQLARYRGETSRWGNFFDKLTDHIQVALWFGTVGYTASVQSGSTLPLLLAFIGVYFYSLRGYTKYTFIYIEASDDRDYIENKAREVAAIEKLRVSKAGPGHGLKANLRWFLGEQRKILSFDEGVFIFMLSAALIFNALTPMLWVFAISQTFYGLLRGYQRGRQLNLGHHPQIMTPTEK